MDWRHFLLVLAVQATLALPVSAGIFFHKQAKPSQAPATLDFIGTLKIDPDEHKREAAAEALRHFDANTSPEVVSALIDALQHDKAIGVRCEAAQSLGKLRPVMPEATTALQQASANDSSMKVRWHARTALMHCHLAGHNGAPAEGPSLNLPANPQPTVPVRPTNREPPLAPAPTGAAVVAPSPVPAAPARAPIVITPVPKAATPSQPRSPLVPTEAPPLESPPSTGDQGPILGPQ